MTGPGCAAEIPRSASLMSLKKLRRARTTPWSFVNRLCPFGPSQTVKWTGRRPPRRCFCLPPWRWRCHHLLEATALAVTVHGSPSCTSPVWIERRSWVWTSSMLAPHYCWLSSTCRTPTCPTYTSYTVNQWDTQVRCLLWIGRYDVVSGIVEAYLFGKNVFFSFLLFFSNWFIDFLFCLFFHGLSRFFFYFTDIALIQCVWITDADVGTVR